MLLTASIGLGSAAALLCAGYLLGSHRGVSAREKLREQGLRQTYELQNLRSLVTREDDRAESKALREALGRMSEALMRQGDALQRIVEPLLHRDTEVESLRTMVQQVLKPLAHREQLAFDLSNLPVPVGQRSELTNLLDRIADAGHFETVVLVNDEGLPLAASTRARDLERLAALSSLLVVFAERLSRNDAPAPLSIVMHDETNTEALCRLFTVGEQRCFWSPSPWACRSRRPRSMPPCQKSARSSPPDRPSAHKDIKCAGSVTAFTDCFLRSWYSGCLCR